MNISFLQSDVKTKSVAVVNRPFWVQCCASEIHPSPFSWRDIWVFDRIAELSLEFSAWHRGPACTYLHSSALRRLFLNSKFTELVSLIHLVSRKLSVSLPPPTPPRLNEIPLGQGLILVNVFTHTGWSSVKLVKLSQGAERRPLGIVTDFQEYQRLLEVK